MRVADGSSTGIYGWTGELRVHPPRHLADNLGTRALITHLPPMQCLVADIAEDVIVGVNYIKPLQGGFATVGNLSFFRLAFNRRPEAPTVLVPLVGQNKACSVHFEVDDGASGPLVKTFMCNTCQAQPPDHPGEAPAVKSSPKQRAAAIDLLQYARRYPHMVTQVEWNIPRMSPDPVLFPESTTLRQEPPSPEALDPRRDAAWTAIETRFADVFAKPSRLPPYRFVNGGCTLKDGGTVPPRAGVGRLSREEITYTRAILCDYLDKGWIRPSYSRTASRLFFLTKPNGGLRSVVDYRAVNDALKTLYFPPRHGLASSAGWGTLRSFRRSTVVISSSRCACGMRIPGSPPFRHASNSLNGEFVPRA